MCVGTFPPAPGPLSGGRELCVHGGEGRAQIKGWANSGMQISPAAPVLCSQLMANRRACSKGSSGLLCLVLPVRAALGWAGLAHVAVPWGVL